MTSPSGVAGAAVVNLAGHPVSRIGYGAMQLAERGGLAAPDRGSALAVLRRAVELGVDHIDTAQFYGAGAANELIHSALHPYPDDLVLVTKVGAEHVAGTLVPAQRPEQVRAAVEANLRSLGVERVPVVNLRRMDAAPGIVATGDQVVDLDAQLAELAALRDEGKIGGIGLSNVDLDQLGRALPVGLECGQNAYSLLDRSAEPLLDVCREEAIAWVPFFPLGSAFPGLPKVTDEPVVIEAARTLHVTPAQVGLAWLLEHAAQVLLIPGTSSVDHLAENVAAVGVTLDPPTIAELDRLYGK